jgi:homoaconitase/3-isopropylmalate dehydratase large subunit
VATVHIYVRSQAEVSSAAADEVAALMAQVKDVVESAGAEWQGSVTVDADDVAPAIEAPEPVAEESHVDPVSSDSSV